MFRLLPRLSTLIRTTTQQSNIAIRLTSTTKSTSSTTPTTTTTTTSQKIKQYNHNQDIKNTVPSLTIHDPILHQTDSFPTQIDQVEKNNDVIKIQKNSSPPPLQNNHLNGRVISELQRMQATRGKQATKHYFMQKLSQGEINSILCGWAMKHLCESSDSVRTLMNIMINNRIPITAGILNIVMNQYLMERDEDAAQHVLNIEFKEYGLIPDAYTYQSIHSQKMKQLWYDQGKEFAMNYLYDIISNGEANGINCGWGIKWLCNTSHQIRDVIEQMNENHIPVEVETLNSFIYQLLLENKKEEAQEVIDIDFQKYRLIPNQKTDDTMKQADHLISIGHTHELSKLLKDHGQTLTMHYLKKLISTSNNEKINEKNENENENDNENEDDNEDEDEDKEDINEIDSTKTLICNWGLKNLCQTPEEVSDFMKHLHQHNIHIDEEMRMTVMLYEDGQESTLNHLIKLIQKRTATVSQCIFGMEKVANNSNEQYEIIDCMNRENQISIDANLLNLLITQLLSENQREKAQDVLEFDFNIYGITPTNKTLKMFEQFKQKEKLHKNKTGQKKSTSFSRSQHLQALRIQSLHQPNATFHIHAMSTLMEQQKLYKNGVLQTTTDSSVFMNGKISAVNYLHEIVSNGKADGSICSWGMRKLMSTSAESKELLNLMETHDVPMHNSILMPLIKQLLMEDKRKEADILFDKDFQTFGGYKGGYNPPYDSLVPNKQIKNLMKRKDELANIGHMNVLQKLLHENGKETSMTYLQNLIKKNKTNANQCVWGMKYLCNTSQEQRVVIEQMHTNQIAINEKVLDTLVTKLLLENKKKEAQEVIDMDYSTYNLKPTKEIFLTMKRSDRLARYGQKSGIYSINNVYFEEVPLEDDAPLEQRVERNYKKAKRFWDAIGRF